MSSETSDPIHFEVLGNFEDFEGSQEAMAHPKQQPSQPKLPSQARSKSALQLQLADARSSSGSSLLLATDPHSTAGGSC